QYDYGAQHPFRLERLWLTEYLCRHYGLFDGEGRVSGFPAARRADLLAAHDPGYLDILEAVSEGIGAPGLAEHGLASGDNPVFPGMWQYALETAGGTLLAAQLVAAGEARRVFHVGGGLHHARAGRASGFCYVNDVVIGIRHLLAGGKRVFYLDLDAHHGDGVEQAFYDDPRVLSFSIHQDGRTLFPGSGFANDIGRGEGRGFAVNVPLLPASSDEAYLRAWDELIVPLLSRFRPDALVTELGSDALLGDPLANLALRLEGWWELMRRIAALGLPWLAVGGGGYDLGNAMRAWTLAWGAMVGWTPDESFPPRPAELPGQAAMMRWPRSLWSPPAAGLGIHPDGEAAAAVIDRVRREVFPHHQLSP
ncbi:MAG: acetoin utilization protein AcuC, partial [Candidatus Eisenbacteria bacterium]|nr:acetoin utilization protein AcuC [Candidatus Eisenbacteria bacterium]